MLQCFFSLFLCFCFSERTSWVVEGTFPRRGGGGGEEEDSPPKGFELLEVGRWWGGGEAEWFGLDAGLTPGLAARLPLRLQKYKIQKYKIQMNCNEMFCTGQSRVVAPAKPAHKH